jgi:hypothetical protein
VPTPADQQVNLLEGLFELWSPRFRPGILRPRLARLSAVFGPADSLARPTKPAAVP